MTIPILLMSASPADRVQLAVDAELDLISRSVRLGSLRDRFTVQHRQETRADELLPLLLEQRPAVLHFSGHGTSTEGLIFEDGEGASHPLGEDVLRQIFSELPHVRCVVLNACYSQVQAAAIAEHVPAVVVMTGVITDEAASAFSEIFYHALAEGHALRSAFDLACTQMRIVDPRSAEAPMWIGDDAAGDEVLAGRPEERHEIARRLYETEFVALAKSISALLDDAAAGSVVEEVFGEFVVAMPPVEAGEELAWLQGRVLTVAGERQAAAPVTGDVKVDRVLEAIRRLPMEQSRVLLYRHYHHHTDDEIASLLGMSASSVESIAEAALAAVAADLGSAT